MIMYFGLRSIFFFTFHRRDGDAEILKSGSAILADVYTWSYEFSSVRPAARPSVRLPVTLFSQDWHIFTDFLHEFRV